MNGVGLEVSEWGSGEPIVFVQTALTADELLPLAQEPMLAHGYYKIVYHRRGYAGSDPLDGPGSIRRDAADCHALLEEIAVDRVHIVGVSYSGAVALQLASDVPELGHSLTLLEPPPVHTPSASEFRAIYDRLIQTRRERGPATALHEFHTMVIGPEWRQVAEGLLPGSAMQMERDMVTFFDSDLPALMDWQFGPTDANHITGPVLYIGGSESGLWFADVRELILSWLPYAEDVVVDGADHSLALIHTSEVASALAEFLRRHPMSS